MFLPCNQSKRYEFEIKRLPLHTRFLIENKKFDNPILRGYFNMLEMKKNVVSNDGKNLILSMPELFFFAFLSNFDKLVPRSHSDLKIPNDFESDFFEQEFCINPLVILTRKYLNFLYHRKPQLENTFKTLLFLLQDFAVNSYIDSKILRNPQNLGNFVSSSHKIDNPQNFSQKFKVPKPHVFCIVYLIIHYFHKNNLAEVGMGKMDFIGRSGFFAKSLYHFFISVLEAWNQDPNNNLNLLSNFGAVWMKFLKPWESEDNLSFVEVLNSEGKSENMANSGYFRVFRNNFVSKEMFKKENTQLISNFFKENSLFYTHVLAKFLNTLAEQREIHFKDIVFLAKFLEFFIGKTDIGQNIGTLFNGFVNVSWLKNLPIGGNTKIEGSLDVIQYVDLMGATQYNLILFNDDAILSRVLKIIPTLRKSFENFKRKQVFYFIKSL